VISLNILPLKAILILGKERSHNAKSGEYGGCGMTVILFLATNSHTDKAK
jgi:hypothetical protein